MPTFSHIFYLKKSKNYFKGPIPIYLRITVKGKRSEISIKRTVDPDRWNSSASKMKGSTDEVKRMNSYLDTLTGKLNEAYHELVRESKNITVETLKNKFTGVEVKQRMLIPIFQKHNDEMKMLVPKEYALGTWKRFETSFSHSKDFLKYKFNVSDIDICDINNEFIKDYDFWLRSVRNCANNSAVKYIKNFKKIIRICIANGWLDKDPFINYKMKINEVDRFYLSEEELKVMSEKEFMNHRITQVKDIFLFSCYTGLAYVDVKKLSHDNISIGIDGKKWIFINRTKTDTPSRIPLLPVALAILEKYREHPQCINKNILLPISSNQKMNAYLKEIADICGINKELTFHIARHTFATTVTLNNNVPVESVSKMLGHKNIRTTQHYAKILDKKVSNDMEALFSKYSIAKSIENEKAMG